jgi:hypothetical protein
VDVQVARGHLAFLSSGQLRLDPDGGLVLAQSHISRPVHGLFLNPALRSAWMESVIFPLLFLLRFFLYNMVCQYVLYSPLMIKKRENPHM